MGTTNAKVPAGLTRRTPAALLYILLAIPGVADSNCPVTLPEHWPGPSEQGVLGGESHTHAWYGSRKLAALIPVDGIWTGTGAENNFADKFWWYRDGFDARTETKPDLVISGLLLDGVAQPIHIDRATAGFGTGWHAMLVGIGFPSPGCWELRGTYNGAEELVLVLDVGVRTAAEP